MSLFYFLLGLVIFLDSRLCRRREFNEGYTSLEQTRPLKGLAILGVMLHHLAQKTCAPWNPRPFIRPGLEFFLDKGYLFVGMFLFLSGLGLYRSRKAKPDYMKRFFRRRVLPTVIAFYLSQYIHVIVRLAAGQKMGSTRIILYLTGIWTAAMNAWFVLILPFFYLAFYLAFRFCRREGAAIGWVTVFALGYAVACSFVDHNGGWLAGEWWYSSIMMFPLGLLFGKYEQPLTARFQKHYPLWLLLSLILAVGLFLLGKAASESWLGYYGEDWGDSLKVPHRLGSAACQWLACGAAVFFCLLLLMKLRLNSPVLGFLGGRTMEYYLMHGMLVDLFGFEFMGIHGPLLYIRSVPLYILAVLAASTAAALLFGWLWKGTVRMLLGREKRGS